MGMIAEAHTLAFLLGMFAGFAVGVLFCLAAAK